MTQRPRYPPVICGPVQNLDESHFEDLTINNKHYKHDKFGNITGYKSCLLVYDSGGYLEEVGIWDTENTKIVEYKFGYQYFDD